MTSLRAQIQKQDFDHPFTISQGDVYEAPVGYWAPTVTHDERDDVLIDAMPGQRWYAVNGFTGQYSYSGAVMHPSEYVGRELAEHLAEIADDEPSTVFALVVVEDDVDADSPVGWAVVYTQGSK